MLLLAIHGGYRLGHAGEPAAVPQLFAPSNDVRPLRTTGTAETEVVASPKDSDPAVPSSLHFARSRWDSGKAAAPTNRSPKPALKWRSRELSATADKAPAATRQPSSAWRNRNAPASHPIRTVGHQQSDDPFDDPFGDRQGDANQGGPALPLLTAQAGDRKSTFQPPAESVRTDDAVPAEEDAAPKYDFPELPPTPAMPDLPGLPEMGQPSLPRTDDFPSLPKAPGETRTTEDAAPVPPRSLRPSGRSIADEPRPGDPGVGTADPLAPSLGPPVTGDQDVPCDRIYNERNCCAEEENCRSAQRALYENSITKISLDITASFKPDAVTAEAESEAREERLRKMAEASGPRTWRNREGESVAVGFLKGVRFRQVTIATEDGQEVRVPLGELSDDDWCFLAAWWEVPTECALGGRSFTPRTWEPLTFTWKASALCHKPLYFEEVQLERYGHTAGPFLQPALSGAHFFANIAVLPYKMGINPPTECRYPLGYYRPGNCAPWLVPPVPISLRGGLIQAGAVVGGVALFP